MSGLVVDIVDLPRATGSVKNLQIRTPAPADLGTEVIGVPEGSDLVLDVTLTSMDDGVLAHADADLHVHGECVRCLRDLDEDRTVRIDELYLFPEAIEAQRAQGDEEAEKSRQLEAWVAVQRGHAVANGLPVIAVNRVGFEGDESGVMEGIKFWGNSFVFGAQGEELFRADSQSELCRIVEIDMTRSEEVRRIWPFLRDRRIDAYANLTKRFID